MRALFRNPPVIHGQTVPGRRPTLWAAVYGVLFVVAPVTALGLGLDYLGWFVSVRLLGAACYGLGCLLD